MASPAVTAPDETRPQPRAALPFRVQPGPGGRRVLWYEDEVAMPGGGARRIPFALEEGIRPFAQILALVEMYRELEGRVDGLLKDLEESAGRASRAEAEARRAQKRTEQFQRKRE